MPEAGDARGDLALVDAILRGRGGGRILIDDADNIAQAVRAGVRVTRIFSTGDDAGAVGAPGVPAVRITGAEAQRLFRDERSSRCFAIADAPPPSRLTDLRDRPGDVIVLDGVRLMGNVGAVIRSSVALGAAGVVLVEPGVRSIHDRRLIRASRGFVFSLPVVLASRAELIRHCASTGLPLYVADARAELSIEQLADVAGRMAIVLGSEKHGCSPQLRAHARSAVNIPTAEEVESLNVSVAAGIALYCRHEQNLGVRSGHAVPGR